MGTTAQIIGASFVGTSLMTAFSHLLSKMEQQNFSEPELLDMALRQWKLVPDSEDKRHIAGWSSHYGVGIAFALTYAFLIKKGYLSTGVLSSIGVGALSGVLAAACWKAALELCPQKPDIDEGKFLLQLIPSHLIFGLVSIQVLRSLGAKQEKRRK